MQERCDIRDVQDIRALQEIHGVPDIHALILEARRQRSAAIAALAARCWSGLAARWRRTPVPRARPRLLRGQR